MGVGCGLPRSAVVGYPRLVTVREFANTFPRTFTLLIVVALLVPVLGLLWLFGTGEAHVVASGVVGEPPVRAEQLIVRVDGEEIVGELYEVPI